MSSHTSSRALFLWAVLGLFFFSQTAMAADGCTAADFTVARSFHVGVDSGFPQTTYAVADLNGDGRLDLVVTESPSYSVSVLINDGLGGFAAPKRYAAGTEPAAVAVGDFNGDSLPDLAVANSETNNVSILLGTGGGLFGGPTNFAAGNDPRAVVVADFNGDTKFDLAIGNIGTNTNGSVTLLLGNGSGSFSPSPGSPFAIAGSAGSLAVADFNSDGKRDLAVATFNGTFVMIGDGLGGFALPVKIYDAGGASVAVADLNGDGKSDLAVGANGLAILIGNGSGGFSAPVVFPHESRGSLRSVAIGDVDGDGKLDVAAATDSPGGVSYFKGDGAGSFVTTRSYLPAASLAYIALGDFDGDSDPDIVAGNSILVNAGGGIFQAPHAVYTFTDITSNQSFATPFDLAPGDFNGDGRQDMAVLHRGQNSQDVRVAILLRNASGVGFTLSSPILFSFGTSLVSLAVADFNNDGRSDVAVSGLASNPFSHIVAVSLSNGDGTFTASNIINMGVEAFDLAAGDVNNDGKADLVYAGRSDSIRILLGNGAGAFSFLFGPSSGATLAQVALADLNNDSKLDLVITDYFGQRVITLLGDGNGFFNTLRAFDVQGPAYAVVAADFNVDGKQDVAIAINFTAGSFGQGKMSILLGDGTGSLAAPVHYPVGEQVEGIVTADLDGDGKLDIAVANQFSNSITVFSGDGAGAFRPGVSFSVWGGPSELAVGDFDSDGRLDLAVPLIGSRTLGLLFGKPASTEPCIFADDVNVTEGSAPGTVDVPVRLSHASAAVVKVNYIIKGDPQAVDGQDFTAGTGTVTFQPGETAKTVPITILDDQIDEDQETLTLSLFDPLNARISDGVAKIGLIDNDPPPTISINDVSVTEADFAPVSAEFTVSLSGPTSHSVTINFQAVSGTATVSEDFEPTQGSLFFGPGQTTKTVIVTVRGDVRRESDETFFVNLSNPVDATIGDGQGQGTILNNDPIPTITILDASATEVVGDSSMTVTVRLSNPSDQTVSVDFATADGTATAGSDYVAAAGTVTFNPGETQKTFTITVKDDAIDEVPETFTINLSNPSNATIADGQALCTLFDNDGPALSINDVSIQEGTGGTINASFTITLSAPSVQTVFVRFGTGGGTATANVDYSAVSQRFIVVPAGSSSVTTTVTVIGDAVIESNETFLVNLTQPTDCTIADGQGVGTIVDDDVTSVQFSTAAITVDETAGIVQVTVQRVGDLSQGFAASYSTADSTASARSDYNATLGTLHFGPGESSKTFSVFITDDALVENSEQFVIFLSGPGGSRTNDPSLLTITITSTDTPGSPNPIDNSEFFVRQHYRDFLNRDPDAPGLAFWTDQIESCGTDAQCREIRRINVSAAFFLSIEFQETGYFVYRAYKAAFGDTTSPNVPGTVPIIRLVEFSRDAQRVGDGVQVGIGDWQQRLEDNKNSYLLEFVQQSRFLFAFPTTMSAQEFVTKLNVTAGGVLSAQEQAELVALLGNTPAEPSFRAAVVRRVIEDADLNHNELNRAFVLMQYYGYLRRNPNDPPDINFAGWKFWLDKLNEFGGNFVAAEMVKSFLVAGEYRGRFGN